jgi:hypothetical protein
VQSRFDNRDSLIVKIHLLGNFASGVIVFRIWRSRGLWTALNKVVRLVSLSAINNRRKLQVNRVPLLRYVTFNYSLYSLRTGLYLR